MSDAIVAIATPPGRGGIGVIRISGERTETILCALIGDLPLPRRAVVRHVRGADNEILDQAVILYFPAPASFTGEAVAELHAHGSPVVLDQLLTRCVGLGARLARPGEFSERAFLNGKMDLAQAEAVADLIDSVSVQAARCALRSLQGEFSRHIHALAEQMVVLRTYLEAGIDFPDEELDLLADGQVIQQLSALQHAVQDTLARAHQGWLLREGMRVVIAGRPNVGKSSLLNALSRRDSAIVTPLAGTTRDIVRETIDLDGMPVQVLDTAGLRDTTDLVEQEGIRRTHHALNEADVVLLLVDERDNHSREELDELFSLAALPAHCDCFYVINKCDLSGVPPGMDEHGLLHISAHTGAGLDDLKSALKTHIGFEAQETGVFMARRRHLDALQRAISHLDAGFIQAQIGASELVAEELRIAHHALGEITGEFSSEDLLSHIFSQFCIGK